MKAKIESQANATTEAQADTQTVARANAEMIANAHAGPCRQAASAPQGRREDGRMASRPCSAGCLTHLIKAVQALPKMEVSREHPVRPTTFDPTRYRTDRPIAVGLSRQLLKKIHSGMAVGAEVAKILSAPEGNGLRWHQCGGAYLQVKDIFIKINKLNGNRYALNDAEPHRKITLKLKKNTFFIEGLRERLKNILTVGLGGRKRKHPVDVLKEQTGFTEESARRLLSQYHFPDHGVYSEYMFALDVEQWGIIPPWAARYNPPPRTGAFTEGIIETVVVLNPHLALHKLKLRLGEQLGEGGFGEVFLDADDNDYVIKRFFSDNNASAIAQHEAEAFQRYYGEQGAQVFYDEKQTPYLRMYKVPGQTLNALVPGSLPADAVQRFVDMLERLTRAGIIHGDLNAENILWDAESKMFFPIDIRNIKHDYFSCEWDEKLEMNETGENEWGEIIEAVEEKIPPSPDQSD
ncbi:OspG family effector kinase [Sodalis praecaptivus]|uniref:OspG family effector kinase n=1 Tax=Sodalis praecaptivus TaxID=1239307 RepID=UPI00280C0E5D|nr:hypothetical protein [Sodalis praecaptivus]